MNLLKAKETERTVADEAAAMRLMAITNRLRPGSSRNAEVEAAPAPHDLQEEGDPK